ncbi:MAG: hypothetical protein AAF153_01160, partial [Pseudomonadota bacterium]
MSLSAAEKAITSGFRAFKQAMDTSSYNIANASNEDHRLVKVRQEHEIVNGKGVGVRNAVPERQLNFAVERELDQISSTKSYYQEINNYNDRIQTLFGVPGTTTTLAYSIDTFFDSIYDLSVEPENIALRTNLVNQADTMARRINELSRELHSLRYEIDGEFNNVINELNYELEQVRQTQLAINLSEASDEDPTVLEDKRDNILRSIYE